MEEPLEPVLGFDRPNLVRRIADDNEVGNQVVGIEEKPKNPRRKWFWAAAFVLALAAIFLFVH